MSVFDDNNVCNSMRGAWEESCPGTPQAHEEGGFILRKSDGSLAIRRWPRGSKKQILVPAHEGGLFDGDILVASFHTHPNIGDDFEQQPSLADILAVRDDPDLQRDEYEGEYVISATLIYRIIRNGVVEIVGETKTLLHLD